MHRGHDLAAPISELEVRATMVPCPECGLMVYMGGFMIVREGEVFFGGKVHQLGEMEVIDSEDACENSTMRVGKKHLRI